MNSAWKSIPVTQVKAGDRIRHQSGVELTVSRVEPTFLGRSESIAFIEDTPERWMKAPVPSDGEIEVWQDG